MKNFFSLFLASGFLIASVVIPSLAQARTFTLCNQRQDPVFFALALFPYVCDTPFGSSHPCGAAYAAFAVSGWWKAEANACASVKIPSKVFSDIVYMSISEKGKIITGPQFKTDRGEIGGWPICATQTKFALFYKNFVRGTEPVMADCSRFELNNPAYPWVPNTQLGQVPNSVLSFVDLIVKESINEYTFTLR